LAGATKENQKKPLSKWQVFGIVHLPNFSQKS
jgi:hypothetical protein